MAKALMRLWRFATCNHINVCRDLELEDTTILRFCTRCGRLIFMADEGDRTHNPHKLKDQLDISSKKSAAFEAAKNV